MGLFDSLRRLFLLRVLFDQGLPGLERDVDGKVGKGKEKGPVPVVFDECCATLGYNFGEIVFRSDVLSREKLLCEFKMAPSRVVESLIISLLGWRNVQITEMPFAEVAGRITLRPQCLAYRGDFGGQELRPVNGHR